MATDYNAYKSAAESYSYESTIANIENPTFSDFMAMQDYTFIYNASGYSKSDSLQDAWKLFLSGDDDGKSYEPYDILNKILSKTSLSSSIKSEFLSAADRLRDHNIYTPEAYMPLLAQAMQKAGISDADTVENYMIDALVAMGRSSTSDVAKVYLSAFEQSYEKAYACAQNSDVEYQKAIMYFTENDSLLEKIFVSGATGLSDNWQNGFDDDIDTYCNKIDYFEHETPDRFAWLFAQFFDSAQAAKDIVNSKYTDTKYADWKELWTEDGGVIDRAFARDMSETFVANSIWGDATLNIVEKMRDAAMSDSDNFADLVKSISTLGGDNPQLYCDVISYYFTNVTYEGKTGVDAMMLLVQEGIDRWQSDSRTSNSEEATLKVFEKSEGYMQYWRASLEYSFGDRPFPSSEAREYFESSHDIVSNVLSIAVANGKLDESTRLAIQDILDEYEKYGVRDPKDLMDVLIDNDAFESAQEAMEYLAQGFVASGLSPYNDDGDVHDYLQMWVSDIDDAYDVTLTDAEIPLYTGSDATDAEIGETAGIVTDALKAAYVNADISQATYETLVAKVAALEERGFDDPVFYQDVLEEAFGTNSELESKYLASGCMANGVTSDFIFESYDLPTSTLVTTTVFDAETKQLSDELLRQTATELYEKKLISQDEYKTLLDKYEMLQELDIQHPELYLRMTMDSLPNLNGQKFAEALGNSCDTVGLTASDALAQYAYGRIAVMSSDTVTTFTTSGAADSAAQAYFSSVDTIFSDAIALGQTSGAISSDEYDAMKEAFANLKASGITHPDQYINIVAEKMDNAENALSLVSNGFMASGLGSTNALYSYSVKELGEIYQETLTAEVFSATAYSNTETITNALLGSSGYTTVKALFHSGATIQASHISDIMSHTSGLSYDQAVTKLNAALSAAGVSSSSDEGLAWSSALLSDFSLIDEKLAEVANALATAEAAYTAFASSHSSIDYYSYYQADQALDALVKEYGGYSTIKASGESIEAKADALVATLDQGIFHNAVLLSVVPSAQTSDVSIILEKFDELGLSSAESKMVLVSALFADETTAKAAIADGIENMGLGTEYKALWATAFARDYADYAQYAKNSVGSGVDDLERAMSSSGLLTAADLSVTNALYNIGVDDPRQLSELATAYFQGDSAKALAALQKAASATNDALWSQGMTFIANDVVSDASVTEYEESSNLELVQAYGLAKAEYNEALFASKAAAYTTTSDPNVASVLTNATTAVSDTVLSMQEAGFSSEADFKAQILASDDEEAKSALLSDMFTQYQTYRDLWQVGAQLRNDLNTNLGSSFVPSNGKFSDAIQKEVFGEEMANWQVGYSLAVTSEKDLISLGFVKSDGKTFDIDAFRKAAFGANPELETQMLEDANIDYAALKAQNQSDFTALQAEIAALSPDGYTADEYERILELELNYAETKYSLSKAKEVLALEGLWDGTTSLPKYDALEVKLNAMGLEMVYKEPVIETVVEAPVIEEPVVEIPVVEEPVIQIPASLVEDTSGELGSGEEPAYEEPGNLELVQAYGIAKAEYNEALFASKAAAYTTTSDPNVASVLTNATTAVSDTVLAMQEAGFSSEADFKAQILASDDEEARNALLSDMFTQYQTYRDLWQVGAQLRNDLNTNLGSSFVPSNGKFSDATQKEVFGEEMANWQVGYSLAVTTERDLISLGFVKSDGTTFDIDAFRKAAFAANPGLETQMLQDANIDYAALKAQNQNDFTVLQAEIAALSPDGYTADEYERILELELNYAETKYSLSKAKEVLALEGLWDGTTSLPNYDALEAKLNAVGLEMVYKEPVVETVVETPVVETPAEVIENTSGELGSGEEPAYEEPGNLELVQAYGIAKAEYNEALFASKAAAYTTTSDPNVASVLTNATTAVSDTVLAMQEAGFSSEADFKAQILASDDEEARNALLSDMFTQYQTYRDLWQVGAQLRNDLNTNLGSSFVPSNGKFSDATQKEVFGEEMANWQVGYSLAVTTEKDLISLGFVKSDGKTFDIDAFRKAAFGANPELETQMLEDANIDYAALKAQNQSDFTALQAEIAALSPDGYTADEYERILELELNYAETKYSLSKAKEVLSLEGLWDSATSLPNYDALEVKLNAVGLEMVYKEPVVETVVEEPVVEIPVVTKPVVEKSPFVEAVVDELIEEPAAPIESQDTHELLSDYLRVKHEYVRAMFEADQTRYTVEPDTELSVAAERLKSAFEEQVAEIKAAGYEDVKAFESAILSGDDIELKKTFITDLFSQYQGYRQLYKEGEAANSIIDASFGSEVFENKGVFIDSDFTELYGDLMGQWIGAGNAMSALASDIINAGFAHVNSGGQTVIDTKALQQAAFEIDPEFKAEVLDEANIDYAFVSKDYQEALLELKEQVSDIDASDGYSMQELESVFELQEKCWIQLAELNETKEILQASDLWTGNAPDTEAIQEEVDAPVEEVPSQEMPIHEASEPVIIAQVLESGQALADAQEKLHEAEDALQSASTRLNSYESWVDTVDLYALADSELKDLVVEREDQTQSLEKVVGQRGEIVAQFDDTYDDIGGVDNHIVSLHDQLGKARMNMSSFERKVGMLEADKADLMRDLHTEEGNLDLIATRYESTADRLDFWASQMEHLKTTDSFYKIVSARYAATQADLDKLAQQHSDAQAKVDELHNKLDVLDVDLSSQHEDLRQATQEAEDVQIEIDSYEMQMLDIEGDLGEHAQHLRTADLAITKLNVDIVTTDHDIDNHKIILDWLKAKVETRAPQDLPQDARVLFGQPQDLQTYAQDKIDFAQMKEEVHGHEHEVMDLRQQTHELEQELNIESGDVPVEAADIDIDDDIDLDHIDKAINH